MTSVEPTTRMFHWSPPWRCLLVEAGFAVALIVLGLVFGTIAERCWGASAWSVVPAVLAGVVAALLLLVGGGGVVVLWLMVGLHTKRLAVIVLVHSDSVWITESPRVDLFPKTVIVPFE